MGKKLLVMKFGGTSVGTPDAMQQVVKIVKAARRDRNRLVVVTSALNGLTDQLLDSAGRAALGDREAYLKTAQSLQDRHMEIAASLISSPRRRSAFKDELQRLVDEFTNFCQAILVLGECSPRALDAVGSIGERLCIRLLAASLNGAGVEAQPVDATRLIVTDDCFQAAHPDMEATSACTARELDPLLDKGIVPVVTGYIGATPSGVTTTLGRGGSDFSAAILGVALQADEVWIWTDVDGVMSADPRIMAEAHTIDQLSYREIAELAYFGARVLHPKTIRPVIEAGIALRVLNTFNPESPGTEIVSELLEENGGRVKAVTAIPGQRLVTVEGRGMLGVPGVAARTFAAVAHTGTSVPLITQASSEQSICFAVPSASASMVVNELEKDFALELSRRDIDRVWASEEVVIVTAVGSGMRSTPGIAGKIFSALGETWST